MPPMYALYIFSILKNKNIEVEYTKNTKDQKKINDADYIIMPTSIIAHETEVEILKTLTDKNKKIFVVGVFSSVMKEKY